MMGTVLELSQRHFVSSAFFGEQCIRVVYNSTTMASPSLSPPLTRSRASSTTSCSPITLHSLGRRCSAFPTPDHLQSGRTTSPVPDLQPLSSSMWDSYWFQWLPLNFSHKENNYSCVTPDRSPRSSTDDCSILPLSTSSHSSFSISDHNALSPKLPPSWRLHLPSVRIFAVVNVL
jgi:hypothetical protein